METAHFCVVNRLNGCKNNGFNLSRVLHSLLKAPGKPGCLPSSVFLLSFWRKSASCFTAKSSREWLHHHRYDEDIFKVRSCFPVWSTEVWSEWGETASWTFYAQEEESVCIRGETVSDCGCWPPCPCIGCWVFIQKLQIQTAWVILPQTSLMVSQTTSVK